MTLENSRNSQDLMHNRLKVRSSALASAAVCIAHSGTAQDLHIHRLSNGSLLCAVGGPLKDSIARLAPAAHIAPLHFDADRRMQMIIGPRNIAPSQAVCTEAQWLLQPDISWRVDVQPDEFFSSHLKCVNMEPH